MNSIREKWEFIRAYGRTQWAPKFHTREQLLSWQNRKVQRFLKKMLPHSPFYQDYYRGLKLEDWRTFPMIEKQLMMEHFSALNTLGVSKDEAFRIALQAEETRDFLPMIGEVTVGLSSGTSGNRGLFLVSAAERAAWAGTVLAKLLPGSLFTEHRIAFFLRANSNLYRSVKGARIQFEFFDLLCPLEDHRSRLIAYQPTILVAPPSMLRWIAEQVRGGRCNIRPNKIISVAEVLDPLDQIYLEETFKQPIHQVYQCTEGFLAATCSYGTIHLNEDIAVIQEYPISVSPDETRFMPIITDFSRTAQPIIRYRLNDILVKRDKPCPCGSVFQAIERIEGRSDDVFFLRHEQSGQPTMIFPDFITRAVIQASEHIAEYRVTQHSENEIEISLKLTDGHTEDHDRSYVQEQVQIGFVRLCHKMNVAVPQLYFSDLNHKPSVTKLRRVVRIWDGPDLGPQF